LIVVAAMAALVLASMIVGVVYKTRSLQRHVKGETVAIRLRTTRFDFGVKKRSPTNTPRGAPQPPARFPH
jgi:hypothetical protein